MTSALLFANRQMTAPTLAADLQAAGIAVTATVQEVSKLVQTVLQHAPDVVVCDEPFPTSGLFETLRVLEQALPCPVMVFTQDADAENIEKATASGVHVYVVDGYAANRLRPLVQLAQARFRQAQQQRKAFEDMATRFEERKVVDRAKGILMRAQQLSDEEAFRVLRSTAMSANLRLGQLSQQVIQSARFAEAVNRAGQLRMLSQRLVKLHLLKAAEPQTPQHSELLQASVAWVDGNVALLRKSVSNLTFGDLLDQVEKSWEQLKSALLLGAAPAVEEQAQGLLQGAERLTALLESSSQATPLRLLNLAGRQRMLSQRYAKFALLALLPADFAADAVQAGMQAAQSEFEQALTYLNSVPLSTAAIQGTLQEAGVAWLTLVAAAKALHKTPGAPERTQALQALAQGSEDLLGLFDQLAAQYERSLDMLVG
jgi:AmiR/NasT family two-component response regulator